MKFKQVTAYFLMILMVIGLALSVPEAVFASSNISEQLAKMQELRAQGNYEECIKIADSLVASDNTLMDAYYNKSLACFHLGNTQEALNTLQKMLQLNPRNEYALFNAACACSILGKNDQAITYLKQLFTLGISYKKSVLTDTDFDPLRNSKAYKKLMGTSIVVGGQLLELDSPPINIEGRTMLPLRAVFEALGAQITWDDATKTVTAAKGSITTSLTIGQKNAQVNGVTKEMDVAPVTQGGRTYVPIRFAAEALGAKVNWDPDGKIAEILTYAPNGSGNNYESIRKELDELTVISIIDGGWPEPYGAPITEGLALVIAKDKKALDLMNSLDSESRAQYMYQTTFDNFALVVGCEPVHMAFICDGKVYYAGDLYYGEEQETELVYFEKGVPFNVVKQYKESYNYKDFYLLPADQRTTSQVGD